MDPLGPYVTLYLDWGSKYNVIFGPRGSKKGGSIFFVTLHWPCAVLQKQIIITVHSYRVGWGGGGNRVKVSHLLVPFV